MTFTHVHTSSRYDRSSEVFEKALDRYMSMSDLLTATEISAHDRANKLREKGWAEYSGNNSGRDDTGVAWKKEVFSKLHAESYIPTNTTYGNMGSPWVTFVVLKKTNGKIIVVGVCHMPHGIENEINDRSFRGQTAYAWLKESRGFKKRANQLKKQFNADAVLLAGDWNVSIKRSGVRAAIKAYAPFYKLNWRSPFPTRGTHAAGRIIDFSLFKGLIKARRTILLPHDESSDHTPYKDSYRFI